MSKITFITLSVFLAAGLSIARSQNVGVQAKVEQGLIFIGQADSKTFYTVENKMSWENSKKFCLREGMTLSTVITPEQLTELEGSRNIKKEAGYWLGAVESNDLAGFEWEGTYVKPFGLPLGKYGNQKRFSCLAFGNSKGENFFYKRNCSKQLRPLCQEH